LELTGYQSRVLHAQNPRLPTPAAQLQRYARLLKMKLGKDQIFKSVGQLAFGLIVFGIIFFLFIYWQSRGYKEYVVYVQVNNEAIFNDTLNAVDPQIFDYGRKFKKEIFDIDNDLDKGDGPNAGKLRWYVCGGIDCDEGWESRFIIKE
jgi:hypothetical protein